MYASKYRTRSSCFSLHVEQQADARRQRLQEPDMRDGGGQLDMAHALAADLRDGNLDAALLADDALVLHALVLAAQALVILDRTEDARAEQAVTLGLERAVVDGFRLLDLAERPGPDALWRGDPDLDLVEGLRPWRPDWRSWSVRSCLNSSREKYAGGTGRALPSKGSARSVIPPRSRRRPSRTARCSSARRSAPATAFP